MHPFALVLSERASAQAWVNFMLGDSERHAADGPFLHLVRINCRRTAIDGRTRRSVAAGHILLLETLEANGTTEMSSSISTFPFECLAIGAPGSNAQGSSITRSRIMHSLETYEY